LRAAPLDPKPVTCLVDPGFPRLTLGVEITDALLASFCDLGNIDPQHGFARGQSIPGRTAIEVALDWPLPPPGATLATIRPDSDSIGAMAVLGLRADGVAISDAIRARIEIVTRSDCFDFGEWASWGAAHPPPVAGEELLPLSLHPFEIRALAASIGSVSDDLSESVAMMRAWLLTGTLPPHGEILVRAADKHAATLWSAGLLRVDSLLNGKVACVKSNYPGAITLGYRYAPLVIAEGTVGGNRKITIAQFERGHIDLHALATRLNAAEPGWGGSATILGSPQGMPSTIEIAEIIQLLEDVGIRL
jgi:hypothetical protein